MEHFAGPLLDDVIDAMAKLVPEENTEDWRSDRIANEEESDVERVAKRVGGRGDERSEVLLFRVRRLSSNGEKGIGDACYGSRCCCCCCYRR